MSRSDMLTVLIATVELEDTLELEIEGIMGSSRPLTAIPDRPTATRPHGLACPQLHAAAHAMLELGCRAHPSTGC
jgi:hypothetical protein